MPMQSFEHIQKKEVFLLLFEILFVIVECTVKSLLNANRI